MEKYLSKCLDSLLVDDDLLPSLEVLVINDGSKDRSSEIAHTYEKKYSGVFRVIDKENGNYGSCINRGLKEATGKYVKILDADDEYITEAFAHLMILLKDLDVDMVITDVFSHDENGHKLRCTRYPIATRKILSFQDAYCKELMVGMCMHVITYRRDLLLTMNYRQTEGISYTDSEWAYVPMLKVKSLYYLDEEVYSYLRGRPGQTMDPAIALKNRVHSVIGIRAMVKSILDAQYDSYEKEQFMYEKLLERIHLTYGSYLFTRDKSVDKKPLIDLDLFIRKNHPVLSEKMESLSYGSSMKGYIKKWRSNNYKTNFKIYNNVVWLYRCFRKSFQ